MGRLGGGSHSRCCPWPASKVPEALSSHGPSKFVLVNGVRGVNHQCPASPLRLVCIPISTRLEDGKKSVGRRTGVLTAQSAPTQIGKDQRLVLVGSVKAWGLLMGSPGSLEPTDVPCGPRPAQVTSVSLLSNLWWLRSTSCCHGNPAGRTAHWTQSWHLQVGLGGPRELGVSFS